MNDKEARAHAAMCAIIEEIERRLAADDQNRGILSSVCQNTEDEPHGRDDHLCQSVDRRAGQKGL